MNNKRILVRTLFTLSFVFLYSKSFAQVTIGSAEKPENYEVLKLVNRGNAQGLRLPRYTTQKLNELSATFVGDSKEKGLLCYDIDQKVPVLWDGTEWVSISSYNFNNGLSVVNGKPVLGGDLVRDTDLSTASHNMAFTTETNGKFSVNTDHLTILNNELRLGSETNKVDWSLNDGVIYDRTENSLFLASDNNGVALTSSTSANLLTAKDDVASITGEFKYTYPDLSGLDVKYPIVATPSTTNGDIAWANLLSTTTTITINTTNHTKEYIRKNGINSGYYPQSSSSSYKWTQISDEFTLDTGLWLILGRYKFYVAQATTTNNYNIYVGIFNTTTGELMYCSSALPERKGSGNSIENENIMSYCSPVINAFFNIDETNKADKYVVKVMSVKQYVYSSVQNWFGPEYLNAIQINK